MRRAYRVNSIAATFSTAGTRAAGLQSMFPTIFEEVRRAVDNGRALQELLVQAGPRYVTALKRARRSKPTQKRSKSKSRNG